MQVRFFTIPIHHAAAAEEELNGFLSTHRIIALDRHFVQDGPDSVWAVCISYLEASTRPQPERRGSKVDYREVLSEADFTLFAKLRSLRKVLAEKEGVPAYALFTNEQLADLVQRRVITLGALREIPGIGEARAQKYGEQFLGIVRAEMQSHGKGNGSSPDEA